MEQVKQYPYGVKVYVVRDRVSDEFGNLMEIQDFNKPISSVLPNHAMAIRFYKKGMASNPFADDSELLYLGWFDKQSPTNSILEPCPQLVLRGDQVQWQGTEEVAVKQNTTAPTTPQEAASASKKR